MDYGFYQDFDVLFFTFFASVTGYNFVKYFGLAKFHHRKLANWLKYIQIFSFLSFIGLCYFAFKLEVKALLFVMGLGIVTFLYAVPFLPRKYFLDRSKNLRGISGLKIYVIAFIWSIVTVLIPLINEGIVLYFDIFIAALQRFIFVVVITLPFEIRDMQFDSLKLATIPQKIGIKRTKGIGFLLLLIFVLMELLKDDTSQLEITILILIAVITGVFLFLSQIRQPKYYSSLWVEGIPGIWLILVLCLT